MRWVGVVCWIIVTGPAWAEREITIPKGNKIRDGVFRAEYLGETGKRAGNAWLGTGFLQAYDIEWAWERGTTDSWRNSLDVSYNLSPPIIDISPGISVGVQDTFNRTGRGRAFYLATTFRYGNDGELNQDIPTELTIGFWSSRSGLLFVGASLPFSKQLLLIGEHNGQRLAAGIELRPVAGVTVKTVFESGATLLGLSLHRRF